MSEMSFDITRLLEEWPFEAGQINVRLIKGDDGEPRIQIRLDLGILQMHTEGRPDGLRPNGCDSLLEFYESSLESAETDPRQLSADDEDAYSEGENLRPGLTEDDCRVLREEAVQYYHRYMALLALDDFEGVVRDTSRNLRVLDLCAKHAQTESDRVALEQYRPYVMMMRARASASQAIADNEPKVAILAIDEGLEALKRYFTDTGDPDGFDQSSEVQMLRGMRDTLVPKLPISQTSELRKRLDQAILEENYELAAILRDELRMLKD